jgi:hypothetical protein
MRPTRLVLAAVLALVGAIWLGQGLGLIGGSLMTGDPVWALIGSVLVGLAIGLVIRERRRPGPPA